MPRETLTSRPRPVPAPAGDAVAGPSRRTGSISPPWAPIPGTRKPRPGATARICVQLRGRRGADHEPDRPARAPGRGAPGDPQVERLGGGVDRRVGGDDEVLELGRLGVRGPAQDVGVAVGAFEERRDRLTARVRVDGHGVRPEPVEQGDRVARRRRADVGPLGIDDDRDVGRDPRPDPLEGGHPVGAERLVEGEVRLDRGGARSGRLDDQHRRTASTPATSAEKPAGSRAGSGSSPRHRTLPTDAVRVASRSR